MVATNGRGRLPRWLVAVGGDRWLVKWLETSQTHSSKQLYETCWVVGLLLRAADSGGGDEGCWWRPLVLVGGLRSGQKPLKTSTTKCTGQHITQVGLIVRWARGGFFRALLAQIKCGKLLDLLSTL